MGQAVLSSCDVELCGQDARLSCEVELRGRTALSSCVVELSCRAAMPSFCAADLCCRADRLAVNPTDKLSDNLVADSGGQTSSWKTLRTTSRTDELLQAP